MTSTTLLRKGHRPRQKRPDARAQFDARTEAFFRLGDTPPPPPPPPPMLEDLHHAAASERRPPRRNLVPLVSTIVAIAAGVCVFAGIRSSRAAETSVTAPSPSPAPSRGVGIAPPSAGIALAEPPGSEDPPLPPSTTALEDREEARRRLAKRDVQGAMERATRSIEADPEDATAYLILGAAQMEALLAKDAAETFKNCIKLAKTGPVHECRALLR